MNVSAGDAKTSALDIAFVFDPQYAMPTFVALSSLLRHKAASTHYRVFCVTADPMPQWHKFVDLVARTPGAEVFSVHPGKQLEELALLRRKAGTVAHVPPVALSKMLLPWLLPSAADGRRILYLDSDMVVLQDLGELRDTDLRHRPLAAVRDIGALFKDATHVKWNSNYFNSGLLLIDPDRWIERNKLDDLREAIRRDDLHRYLDQDALNTAFRDEVRLLAPKWNVIVPTVAKLAAKGMDAFNERYGTSYGDAQSLVDDAAVLHYAGTTFKPWRNPSRFLAERWWAEYDAAVGARVPVPDGA